MSFFKWSKTAATNSAADATINWAEGQSPSSVNDSARAMMAALAKYRDDVAGGAATSGTSTAYTITSNQGFTSLTLMDNAELTIVPNVTNAAGATLAVDGLTAKAINISSSVAAPAGFLLAGTPYRLTYSNSSGVFIVQNVSSVLDDLSIADDLAVTGDATIGGTLAVTGASTFAGVTGTTGSFSGVLTQSSTSHGILPKGTTAQRPGSPAAGHYRFNTTTGAVEFHDGAAWNSISIASPIAGGYKGLVIANNSGTPDTKIDLTAAAVTVETSGGVAYRLSSVSVTINAATTGANALDTGALAADTWYAVYVIYNPSTATTAGLVSTSFSSPTLPSGYTASARLGAFMTDSSSYFYRLKQAGNRAVYVVTAGTNTAATRLMISGTLGSALIPTWVAQSVSAFVPPTASSIIVCLAIYSDNYVSIVAPNNSYGAYSDVTNPPPISRLSRTSVTQDMLLESTNIYVALGGTNAVRCAGWVDNI